MDNGHLHDDKLFRAVNERLSDYEAPYNGADWDAMSRSLDKLPKTSRFQWKISLNSLIVGVAIAGLSVLAYTLAAGNGSASPAPQAIQEVKPSPGSHPVKTSLPANTLQATTTTPATDDAQAAVAETTPATSGMGMTDMMAGQQQAKTKRNSSKLRFGDEIDPRKGFIYETREDKNIVEQAPVDKTPDTYYDMEGGRVKKIVIDSTTHTGEKKEIPEPQQAAPETPSAPAAPIQGGPTGFGEIEGY